MPRESKLAGYAFRLRRYGAFAQFYYLALLHIHAVYNKPDKGAHFVPAVHPCSAGVHMQAFEFVVVNDLEDV